MKKKERYQAFIDYFSLHQPNPKTELIHSNTFELLVAVILSAQCTDKRVNQVTPALFTRFPTPSLLAAATEENLFPYIRTISYPHAKTGYLIHTAKRIVTEFQGQVPANLTALISLPGVGRKTANVILATAYHQPAMPVDTHVMRVSKRIGLVSPRSTTPLAIENELTAYIPTSYLHKAHHWILLHGRYICLARKPKCASCPISSLCLYYKKNVDNLTKR